MEPEGLFLDIWTFFKKDSCPDLQKKTANVHKIIKELKRKDVQAKCLHPAKVKIYLDTGEETFATLTEATLLLQSRGMLWRNGACYGQLKEGWMLREKGSGLFTQP